MPVHEGRLNLSVQSNQLDAMSPPRKRPAAPSSQPRAKPSASSRGTKPAARNLKPVNKQPSAARKNAGAAPSGRAAQSMRNATSAQRERPIAASKRPLAGAGRSPAPADSHAKRLSGETRAKPRAAPPMPASAPVIVAPSEVRILAVDPERAGQRIDNFLASQLKGLPKSAIYRLLRTGQVRINGKRVKPEVKIEAGDAVRIPPVRLDAPGAVVAPGPSLRGALDQAILYEDRELLVLNKPSGLASHGGSGISLGAIEALRAIRPEDSLELVHRLDRDTSGLLLFARKHSALRRLQALIREGSMQKRYFALIEGSPERDHFEVDAPLRKNQLRGGERMVAVEADGKPSLSRFRVVEQFAQAALVEVEIITGRTHQIRVHALHSGHPLAGDEKYGDADFNKSMRDYGLKRLFLHAHSLAFPWGEHGVLRHFDAPLSEDLKTVLARMAAGRR